MTKMAHNVTTMVLPAAFPALTASDARWRTDTAPSARAPMCDSTGLVDSGVMGGACSRDLTCMCDACVSIDRETMCAVTRAASSVRMAPVSARLASVARPMVTTAGTWFALAVTLATGGLVGAIFGYMLAGAVR